MMKILIAPLAALFTATASPTYADNQSSDAKQACHINVKLKQSRFSLNPFQHAKDGMNAVEFALPVACDKLDALEVGEKFLDRGRVGSLILRRSMGKWKMRVADIPEIPNPESTSCDVVLRLQQSHFSLNPLTHLRDNVNGTEFEWPVSCSSYDGMNIGDNIIANDFRWGSLLVDQSIGNWSLSVEEKKGPTP